MKSKHYRVERKGTIRTFEARDVKEAKSSAFAICHEFHN